MAHMLKAIHTQESREAAEQKARTIIADLRASKMSKAAELVERAVNETLTYYAFRIPPLRAALSDASEYRTS